MNHPIQHWLIFGDAGAGKTTAATTFPKPILVFQFDPLGKETPYLQRGVVQESKATDGTFVRDVLSRSTGDLLIRIEHYLDSDPQKPTAYRRFLNRLVNLERDIEAEGFRTVVIDSATFMELMARKLAQYVLNPTSREPRQWFASSTDTLEEVLMIRLGSLPINVVVLAHISDDKDELHGFMVSNPALPGRMSKRGPAGYGELYRAYVTVDEKGTREFLWQTRSGGRWNAASQIGAPDPCPQDYTALWLG